MPNNINPEITPSNSDLPVACPQTEDVPNGSIVQQSEQTSAQKLANLKTQAEISDIDNLRELKKEIAYYAKQLSTSSIILWAMTIVVQIITGLLDKPVFNDNIFIAITTGCTVNILAVLLAVTKGLFK